MKENYYSWPNILKLKILFLLLKSRSKLNDFSNTYLITGMPRGGTTWLAEIFNTVPNSLYLHEPLKTGRIKKFNSLLHEIHHFKREDSKWPEAKSIFDKLFRGEILNPSLVEKSKNLEDILNTSSLVIKFVRLNRILPWIAYNYTTVNTPVYIVRHPCAVVHSQLNHGAWKSAGKILYPYQFDLKEFGLFDFFGMKVNRFIEIKSIEQHLALAWCLDALPIYFKNNNNWITISYEYTVQKKEKVIEKLFNRLGLQMNERTYKKLYSPSFSSEETSPPESNAIKQILKWKQGLNRKQIDDINEIVEYFSIDTYKFDEPEPDYKNFNWFL